MQAKLIFQGIQYGHQRHVHKKELKFMKLWEMQTKVIFWLQIASTWMMTLMILRGGGGYDTLFWPWANYFKGDGPNPPILSLWFVSLTCTKPPISYHGVYWDPHLGTLWANSTLANSWNQHCDEKWFTTKLFLGILVRRHINITENVSENVSENSKYD